MDKDQITFVPDHAHLAIIYVFNIISIFFSSFLLITIIALKARGIGFSNRVSLRLIMCISIIEIFFSIFQILRLSPNIPPWVSYISSLGYIFSTLLICLLILTILINLQLVFIHNYKDPYHIKNHYLIISVSLAMMLSIVPVVFGGLKFDQERRYIWYNTPIVEWFAYQGWIAFTILYSIFSLIFIRYRLSKLSQKLMDSTDSTDSASSTDSTMVSSPTSEQIHSEPLLKHVSRIISYSTIPILAYLPTMTTQIIYLLTKQNNLAIDLFSLIMMSSQSMFTFIIFLFDPVIDEAILEHERNLQLKQVILDKVKKGVYVDNIYNINRELPSSSNKSRRQSKRTSIYVYAKNRISGITSVINANNNMKKSMEIKKDIFNFNSSREDDVLLLL